MYAVIFKATIDKFDDEYYQSAQKLKTLALESFGCVDIVSVTEGCQEITISYWESEQQIKEWKEQSDHLMAQQTGRSRWYTSYQVQVVEVQREYGKD